MKQLLSFLGVLLTSKFHVCRIPVSGIHEVDGTSSGELVMARKLQVGTTIEDEFYFPEHGKLIRITDGRVQTFQEQEEGQ